MKNLHKFTSLILASSIFFNYATRVIDGDTLVINDGRHVRLLGINAPEIRKRGISGGEPYALEAKTRLEELVNGKKVRIEYDFNDANKTDKDKYGRTLAYIIVDGEDAGVTLVRGGYVRAYMYKGLTRKNQILEAEQEARQEERGIWAGK
jgi:endonuclease YncB( thermonuclease family)